ncbi:MAG: DUF3298 domain-containing protein [Bdellovibrio bacteriovorus]
MSQPAPSAALLIPLILGCVALPAQGASFDCAKATSWVEQTICEDPSLGELDERLAAALRKAQEAAEKDPVALERLASEQTAWLAERDGCKLTPCVSRAYARRLAQLAGTAEPQTQPLGEQQIQESVPHLSIEAVYPVLPGEGPAVSAANQEIRALVDGVIGSFRGQAEDYAAGPGAEDQGWEGPDWSLTLDYDSPHRTDRLLAVPFTGYEFTGGAHGMPLILPLIIDLSSGQRVPPEGLFAPGSPWLERLSELSLVALQGRDLLSADDQWLREGTAPNLENFSLLFPGPDGLTITFAPYSVAPYAAGIQEVLIPYAKLSGLLNPSLFGTPEASVEAALPAHK